VNSTCAVLILQLVEQSYAINNFLYDQQVQSSFVFARFLSSFFVYILDDVPLLLVQTVLLLI